MDMYRKKLNFDTKTDIFFCMQEQRLLRNKNICRNGNANEMLILLY